MFEDLKYSLRHNRKSVVKRVTAWMIFSAIILVFVFWGLNKQNQGVATGGAALTVNDTIVSLFDFNEAMDRARRDPRSEQLLSLGGDMGRQILQGQVRDQLVEMALLTQAAEHERVMTSDAEVRDILMAVPTFQQDGKFSPVLYHNFLDSSRKTASEIEDEIRRDQSIRRMVGLFNDSLKPLKIEDDKMKALKSLKANIDFASIQPDTLVQPSSISAEAKKAYVANAANENALKDYYNSPKHKTEFSAPEQVKVRHILIRAKEGDAEAEKAALGKIQDIAKRAKTEDFAKLAKEYSEDPGSKASGGLIDFFMRGKMVPQFEQAAFSQPVGKVGEPVKTSYGYHLIEVLDKKAASERKLEEAKEEIAGILLAKDQSESQMKDLESKMKADDVAGVNKFVADHKLKWEETGAFSINAASIPKVGATDSEAIMRAAFSLSPSKPLPSSLIPDGLKMLIVKYLPVQSAAPAKPGKGDKKINLAGSDANDDLDPGGEMAASRRAQEPLRLWMQGLRSSAKITSNAQVFSKGSTPFQPSSDD